MRRAATAVVLLALSGCGGDERSPEEVARAYVASDDPAKCDDADLRFLEGQTRERGDEARAACRRNVETTTPPRDVRVRSTGTRGDDAVVLLETAGELIRVQLARDGDRWIVVGLNVN
jgi:hypothetical protein